MGLPDAVKSKETIKLLVENLVNIKDEDGKFLLKLHDGTLVDTKGWNDWEWTHGVALIALMRIYEQTKDEYFLNVIENWFDGRLKTPRHKNVNTFAAMSTLVDLYVMRQNPFHKQVLEEWADWAMNEAPRTKENGFQHLTYIDLNPGQLWDDTLMMMVVPLARIGKLFNRPEYIEEAKRQFLLHVKYLVDRPTGLWYHGWTFDENHHFSAALWGRGNCWITTAIPDFVDLLELQATDPIYKHLQSTLQAQIDALKDLINPETNLFHTLLDDPTSYDESSATAGFAYGILKAVRIGLIKDDENGTYENFGRKALQGVVDHIDSSGELVHCSFGTPIFRTLQEYKEVPRTSMPYGQALALLVLGEWIRRT